MHFYASSHREIFGGNSIGLYRAYNPVLIHEGISLSFPHKNQIPRGYKPQKNQMVIEGFGREKAPSAEHSRPVVRKSWGYQFYLSFVR